MKDVRVECGLFVLDMIMIYEVGCDLFVVSVEDEWFNVFLDVCFIINRIYCVINWCEYDGELDLIWIGRDENCDGEVGEEVIWVINWNGLVYIDWDNDFENVKLVVGEKDEVCDGIINLEGYWRIVELNGYWEYI